MFSDTFDLEFKTSKDDLTVPPLVQIRLASYFIGENATPIITPRLMGKVEFTGQVDKLILELLDIRAKGVRKLDTYERELDKKMASR